MNSVLGTTAGAISTKICRSVSGSAGNRSGKLPTVLLNMLQRPEGDAENRILPTKIETLFGMDLWRAVCADAVDPGIHVRRSGGAISGLSMPRVMWGVGFSRACLFLVLASLGRMLVQSVAVWYA